MPPTRRIGSDAFPISGGAMKSGIPVPSAAVTVTNVNTGQTAALFSDEFLTVPVANPFTSDANGRYSFFVEPGQYSFSIAGADTPDNIIIGGQAETAARYEDLLIGQSAPTLGAIAESFPRNSASVVDLGGSVLATGTLYVIQLPVQPGRLVSALSFQSGATAGATLTNQWAVLLDSTRKVLAVSPDATSAAWAANTVKTFTFGTAVAPGGVGPYYAGLNVTATTPPSLTGIVDFSNTTSARLPVLAGTSTTAGTVPPALAAVQSAFTAVANKVYVTAS